MKDLLDIKEVCDLAQISKPTIYRRIKNGTFPKPIKIRSKETRGPRHINRWERGEIIGWLLKGNKAEDITIQHIAKETEPGLNALFMDAAIRNAEGADLEDIYKTDDPRPTVWQKYKYIIMAVAAGAISGILTGMF